MFKNFFTLLTLARYMFIKVMFCILLFFQALKKKEQQRFLSPWRDKKKTKSCLFIRAGFMKPETQKARKERDQKVIGKLSTSHYSFTIPFWVLILIFGANIVY